MTSKVCSSAKLKALLVGIVHGKLLVGGSYSVIFGSARSSRLG